MKSKHLEESIEALFKRATAEYSENQGNSPQMRTLNNEIFQQLRNAVQLYQKNQLKGEKPKNEFKSITSI